MNESKINITENREETIIEGAKIVAGMLKASQDHIIKNSSPMLCFITSSWPDHLLDRDIIGKERNVKGFIPKISPTITKIRHLIFESDRSVEAIAKILDTYYK